jgi:hypothetical protein
VNKKLAAAAAAVVIVGGGVAATLTVAGAQTGTTSPPTTAQPQGRPDRGAAQKSALDPLVQDGTISQDQEAKVLSALETAGPKGPGGLETAGPKGPGGPGFGGPGFGRGADLSAVAQVLGITTDQLKTDLEAGRSIADIAKAQNVDVAKVVQAIVDAANAKLDEAVQSGKLTQDQADKIKADETQRITDMVNGKMPFGGHGGPGGHGPGHGHDGTPPSTTTPTTTS